MLSGCQNQVFLAEQKLLRTHLWRSGSSLSRGSRISLWRRMGAGSYIPPINIVGLASLSGFAASWHRPAHVPTTEFASSPNPSGHNTMASANLKSCIWKTTRCRVLSLSWTPSTPKGMLRPRPWPCLVCCRGRAPRAAAQPLLVPRLWGCEGTAWAPPVLPWEQQLSGRVPAGGKPATWERQRTEAHCAQHPPPSLKDLPSAWILH